MKGWAGRKGDRSGLNPLVVLKGAKNGPNCGMVSKGAREPGKIFGTEKFCCKKKTLQLPEDGTNPDLGEKALATRENFSVKNPLAKRRGHQKKGKV